MGISKETHTIVDHDKYFYRFSLFQLIRPMTFTGTIGPMLVGTGIAAEKGPVRFDVFIVLLIATLFIQAATNMLNDYFDFRNGQDHEKWTRENNTVQHGPAHHSIPYIAGIMIAGAIVLGYWLTIQSSIWIIFAGILGITFGFFYSAGPRPLCSIGLGEVIAAIFLGLLTTILAYVVQGNPVDIPILAISLPFALLISSMILTNNIRDIEKDHAFRRTLGIILGRKKAVYLLTTLLISSYLWVIILIFNGMVCWASGAVFLALPLAIKLRWSFRHSASRVDEIKGMKWAALHHWAFSLLFACGVWFGI